jgi:hypothetical protein
VLLSAEEALSSQAERIKVYGLIVLFEGCRIKLLNPRARTRTDRFAVALEPEEEQSGDREKHTDRANSGPAGKSPGLRAYEGADRTA